MMPFFGPGRPLIPFPTRLRNQPDPQQQEQQFQQQQQALGDFLVRWAQMVRPPLPPPGAGGPGQREQRNCGEHGACEEHAEEIATLMARNALTRAFVHEIGIGPALLAIRQLPFRPDDGAGTEDSLACPPVQQRLAFARNGWNCFERATAGAALLQAAGWPDVQVLTERTANGLHSYPTVRSVRICLDPTIIRNGDDWKEQAQPIMEVLHAIGTVILDAYGLGAVAELAGEGWRAVGLLPPKKKKEQ